VRALVQAIGISASADKLQTRVAAAS
jgi:hypothetical protein